MKPDESSFKFYWDIIIAVLLLYSLIEVPYNLSVSLEVLD